MTDKYKDAPVAAEALTNNKKIATVSKIVGCLVQSESSASEALEILEAAKNTFLDRCWHISSNRTTK